MEFLPDSGHAVPDESGDTMSRRARRNHTPAFIVVVEAHQAGLRDRCRHRMESIEPAGIGNELQPDQYWAGRVGGGRPWANRPMHSSNFGAIVSPIGGVIIGEASPMPDCAVRELDDDAHADRLWLR